MCGNDTADVSPDCYTNCSQEHTKNVLSISKIKQHFNFDFNKHIITLRIYSWGAFILFSLLQYCTSMLLNDSKTELNLSLKFPI